MHIASAKSGLRSSRNIRSCLVSSSLLSALSLYRSSPSSLNGCDRAGARDYEAFLGLQPIMPLDLPVKVRSWELTVYPRSHIRRWFGVTRPAQARM